MNDIKINVLFIYNELFYIEHVKIQITAALLA